MNCARWTLAVVALSTFPTLLWAQSGTAAYRGLGLKPQEVLTGTIINSTVVPGGRKQVICLATYLTGKKDKAEAVNVKLGVFEASDKDLVPVYTRDFGAEKGGYVAHGDLQVLDIDLDGINEIIVSYDSFEDPTIEQRLAEVILHDGSGFRSAWTGVIEYDATKAARSVPEERRDRFVREFDWGPTMRSRGATLFVNKTVVAVAGERLEEPRSFQETFALRGGPRRW